MNAAQRRQLAERIAADLLNIYIANGLMTKEAMPDAVRLVELNLEAAETQARIDYLEQHGYARGCDEH